MKQSVLIILFTHILCLTNLYGQNNQDSLLSIFYEDEQDSNRINALHQFVKTNYNTPDSAIKYAQFAVEFAKNIKSDLWQAKSYNLLAISHYYQGDLIKSKDNLNKSLFFYTKLKNKSGMATCYNGIGVVNYDQGKLYDALQLFIKSMRIKQKIGDKASIAMTLNNIGNVYKDLNKFNKSLEYYNKSLEIKKEIKDLHGEAMTLNNIGLLYHNNGNYLKATDYYSKSLKIKREIKDLHGEAMTLNNIGLTFEVQKDYQQALFYYLQSVAIREHIDDQYGIAMNLINIATVYREMGQYNSTYDYLERAEKIALENGANTQLKDCYQRLYETYELQGKNAPAYKYYKLYIATKDSMMSEESMKHIEKLQAQYENEKQDLIIQNLSKKEEISRAELAKNKAELNSKRIVNYSLIIGLIISLCLFIYIIYSLKQRKKKNRQLEESLLEKEVLLKEVHHRVKNNFQLISSLLNLHLNNSENDAVQQALTEAKDRISSMALVHEKLYQSRSLSNINLKEYITDLALHLVQNFEGDVETDIDVADIDVKIEILIPLGLIFNELITNSIKYAFNWNKEKKIEIKIQKIENKLFVKYSDNGPGLPENFDIDNIESLGLNLVQILVLQIHGKLQIDKSDGTAFKFSFTDEV